MGSGSLRHDFWRPGRFTIRFAGADPIPVRATMGEAASWTDGDDGTECRFDYGSRDLHRNGAWLATLPRQRWWSPEYDDAEVEVCGAGAWPLTEDRRAWVGSTIHLHRPISEDVEDGTLGPRAPLLRVGRGFCGWRASLVGPRRFGHRHDLSAEERAVCIAMLADQAVSHRG